MHAELQSILLDVRAFLEMAGHLGVDGAPLSSTSERGLHGGEGDPRSTRPIERKGSPVPAAHTSLSSTTDSIPPPHASGAWKAQPSPGPMKPIGQPPSLLHGERGSTSELTGSKFGPSRAMLQSLSPLMGRAASSDQNPSVGPMNDPSPASEGTQVGIERTEQKGRTLEGAALQRTPPGERFAGTPAKPVQAQSLVTERRYDGAGQTQARHEMLPPRGLESQLAQGAQSSRPRVLDQVPPREQSGQEQLRTAQGSLAPERAGGTASSLGAMDSTSVEPFLPQPEPENPNQGSLFGSVERRRPTQVLVFEQPFSAPPPVDREGALLQFQADVGLCTRCGLCNSRSELVFGKGSAEAEILLVGDAPGASEEVEHRPLTGEAGAMLERISQTMLQRPLDQTYVTNAVLCSPMPGASPSEAELVSCRSFLDRQIEIIRPRVIVTLGPLSARSLLRSSESLARLRGHWYSYRGLPLMPTFHPRDLVQNASLKRPVKEDMERVGETLGILPRKPRT